ncbi:MAG TPA: helix-turn-helix transcriptional regulator [Sandaracinaceae bacterium LLY-WYZ-13_1]|nr:helix-turn-helix transcriptional regulator [Sandaracinaceae bacterium LLY-WYZ-13_1]
MSSFKPKLIGPLPAAEIKRRTDLLLARIGERVGEFREMHELNRSGLAHVAGLDPSVITHIESGRMNITARTAVKLTVALGLEPWDLHVPRELAPDLKPKHRRHRPPSDAVLERHTRRFLKQIGRRVRALRQLQGMSMMTLEEFTGFTNSSLSNIEGGKANISTAIAVRLAEAIGVQPHELYVPTEQSGIREKNEP